MPHQCEEKNNNDTCKGSSTNNRPTCLKKTASEHPSVRTLLGSTDQEILDVAGCVSQGQYKVAPSVVPRRLKDQFMAELHKELSKWLVRAILQSAMATAWSLSREKRC